MNEPRQIALCRTASDILDALAARKAEIGLSNAHVEELADLAAGQLDKMMGPSLARPLDVFKLGDLMEILAVDIAFVHSPEKAQRMHDRWEKRDKGKVHFPQHRVSKVAVKRATPLVLKQFSERGNAARKLLLPGMEQARIAQKAARARARLPKRQRTEISRKGWVTRRKNEAERAKREQCAANGSARIKPRNPDQVGQRECKNPQ